MHLISIHPVHVEAILTGRKTVECRKSSIGLCVGDLLMLYATAPTKAVLGRARVQDLYRDTPAELWRHYRERTGVSEADFFAYYGSAEKAVFIGLADVEVLPKPVPLAMLREHHPGFSPPQTARALGKALHELLAAA